MAKQKKIKFEMKENIPNAIEQKATNTAFILMFPALILAGMAALYAPVVGSLLAIVLALYQFLMLKKFIEDYYVMRS